MCQNAPHVGTFYDIDLLLRTYSSKSAPVSFLEHQLFQSLCSIKNLTPLILYEWVQQKQQCVNRHLAQDASCAPLSVQVVSFGTVNLLQRDAVTPSPWASTQSSSIHTTIAALYCIQMGPLPLQMKRDNLIDTLLEGVWEIQNRYPLQFPCSYLKWIQLIIWISA